MFIGPKHCIGIYTVKVSDKVPGENIVRQRNKYDLRKFYFSTRTVDHWNSLPNWVVNANNTNVFKNRPDQYWQHQAHPVSKLYFCVGRLKLKMFMSQPVRVGGLGHPGYLARSLQHSCYLTNFIDFAIKSLNFHLGFALKSLLLFSSPPGPCWATSVPKTPAHFVRGGLIPDRRGSTLLIACASI